MTSSHFTSHLDLAGIVQSTLTALALLNELCLLCNHWIILPSVTADSQGPHQGFDSGNRSLLTTGAYAICKPLVTELLLHLPIPLWIHLLLLPAYSLFWIELGSMAIDFIALEREKATVCGANPTQEKQQNIVNGTNEPHQQRQEHDLPVSELLLALAAAAAAAVCDTALLITAKSMDLPSNRRTHIAALTALAVVLYIGCMAFANYILCERLNRSSLLSLLRESNAGTWMTMMAYLAIEHLATNGLRLALGQSTWLNAVLMPDADLEELFGDHRYTDFVGFATKIPWWVSPLSNVISLAFAVGGTWLIIRALRDGRRGK